MRRRSVLLVLAVLLLSLSACSGGGSGPEGGASEGTAGSEPQGGGEARVAAGETVDLTELSNAFDDVEWTVESVSQDATCPAGDQPENGQYVQVVVTATTSGSTEQPTGVSSFEWVAVGESGEETGTDPLVTQLCFTPEEQFPISFGGETERTGTLLFDAPVGTTALVGEIAIETPAPTLTIEVP